MTDRERRHAKKQWRNEKKALRKRQEKAIEFKRTLVTPPSSPEQNQKGMSRQKQQALKHQNKEKAKVYRDNKLKEIEISNLKRKVYSCRKRLNRLKEKSVKRALFNFQVLIQQLKQKNEKEQKREKNRLARNIAGPIIKKYGLKQETFRLIVINIDKHRSRRKPCLTRRVKEKVHAFYLREDNSRIITGMKSTVTKRKQKKQKRKLWDSLKCLHRKFLSEGNTKPSYTVFARLRPFWVLFPCEADRNTCLCKICDNINLMVNALHKADVLSSNKVDDVVKETVCDECTYECMYGLCDTCKDRKVNIDDKTLDKTVSWSQWPIKKEKRLLKDVKERVISFTVKETENDKASDKKIKDYLKMPKKENLQNKEL
ncbi:hypothetical protein MAR_031661 [Mya arenaria]|uniref:Uncharacterized protein n=1 Tax=Mya arenaria TaxID=6604 RepID=A0ABY7F7S2_MYAAR|nr:hypothetical protein MAR_031661 [Mya arenaria]